MDMQRHTRSFADVCTRLSIPQQRKESTVLSINDLPANELADIRRASSIKRKLIELPEDLRPHGFKVHEGRLYVNGSELVGLGNAEATSLTSGDLVLTVMLRPYADEIEAAYDAYMATRNDVMDQAQAIIAA